MQDRPTVLELLREVERFLQELASSLEGGRRFQALVAANAVRIVMRELEGEEDQLRQEWEALDRLLGPQPMPNLTSQLREGVKERLQELCRRINQGEADPSHPLREGIISFLWLLTRHKLQVNDPGWLERPRA